MAESLYEFYLLAQINFIFDGLSFGRKLGFLRDLSTNFCTITAKDDNVGSVLEKQVSKSMKMNSLSLKILRNEVFIFTQQRRLTLLLRTPLFP